MALPLSIADRVYATTLSLLRAEGVEGAAELTIQQLAREVFNRYGGVRGRYNYSEYRSIVNSAVAGWEAGALLREGTGLPTPPRDNTIPVNRPDYRYTTVVTGFDAAGRVVDRMVTVYSDRPLSYEDIRQDAIQQAANDASQQTGSDRDKAIIDHPSTTVAILTAGGRR